MINKLKEKRRKYILSKPLPKYKKILDMLPEKEEILDAGCGKGELSKYLLEKNKDFLIIGIDTKKNCEFEHKNFKYIQKDLNKELKLKQKFDVIIFADVLEHLKNPRKVLEETSKYTDNFIISIPNSNFFLFRIHPKLENPPKGESQHLHHWKFKEFLKILPENFKIKRIKFCSDFPEFRWTNYFPFEGKSFFNQTMIMEIKEK